MLKRAARLLVLASFLVSMGLHTAALQAFAWARMAVAFARHDTIGVSLAKTFDGRHECSICLSLRKAGPAASLAAAPAHSPLSLVPPTAAPRAARVALAWGVAPTRAPALSRSSAPLAPPPKPVLS